MSLRLLTPAPLFRRLVRTLSTALILLFVSNAALAQSSWRLLDLGLESGFKDAYEWPTAGSTLHFLDSLRGYYYPENELAPGVRSYYATTDGGVTWSTMPAYVPVPQRMLDATFGISSIGWLTRNGGTSWERVRPPLDPAFNYLGTSLVAAYPEYLVALSQPFETDATSGQLRPIGPGRLTTSTTGGTTWVSVDSMVVETIAGSDERKLELYDSTGFGDLPAPANMTDTFSVGWWQLYEMPDSLTAVVSSLAFGRVGGVLQNHYYLGRLNLRTMTAAWTKLPFVDVVPTTTMRPEGIQFITPTVGWAVQSVTEGSNQRYVYWRTTNAGLTWTQAPMPAWIDFTSLRFLSPQLGIALNAITTDGGATWKQWAHPFEGGAFFASDSTHYFVANRFSLFARSTDAGRTWKRNESGAVPRAIVAYGGDVVVGRSYRSILSSTDRGETWRDADLEGSVPPTMTTVWALAIPDSMENPKRVLGVASFIGYNADTTLGVIESTDGGLTWINQGPLAGTKAPSGSVVMEFAQAAESANTGYIATGRRLYTSVDEGKTWTITDTTLFYQAIESADAERAIQVNATGIHLTTNSGATWARTQVLPGARNRALGLQAFDRQTIRSLFPDRSKRNVQWSLASSNDGGQTWTLDSLSGAPLPLDGYAFWRDIDSVYAVGRGATMQKSLDGGRTFNHLKDSSAEFRALGGWIAAGIDERHIYVAGAGDAIGLWELIARPTSAPGEVTQSIAAHLLSNVVSDLATLELQIDSPSRISIDVVDIVGRVVIADASDLGVARHRVGLRVGGLAAGGYFVRVSDGTAVTVLPLRIAR